MTRAALLGLALALAACTAPSVPAATVAPQTAPWTAAIEPRLDGRPTLFGRPWLRQRATLHLRGAEATLVLASESGVRDFQCPQELQGTNQEGCASPEAARARAARVDRAEVSRRGAVQTDGASVTLVLGGDAGVLTLRCRRAGDALRCPAPEGWPVPEGFVAPDAVDFVR